MKEADWLLVGMYIGAAMYAALLGWIFYESTR